uniref:Pre-mRNA-splicing factor ATP-dependent RNA helicase DEAH1-like isoform X1 n=1 Tax=Tanacetum cinerariifolium TaxID=118510 RepID=A0A6L2MB48_TANCI|nr:pre-mRNA-splicing factor ATP-dependent RNA helicase DEAH1-like isoform X1 [Tanacetum cinerariifolium]
MTRQLLDSQGPIPNKTPAQTLDAIQTMVDHSQKLHDESTSRKENVHAIQVGAKPTRELTLTKNACFLKRSKALRKSSMESLDDPFQIARTMLDIVKQIKSYKLLEADDDDENVVASQSKKTDKRIKRFRKKSENQEDEDDEGVGHLRQDKRAKHKASRDETDESESEEERFRDQQDREVLENHLREKDASRTAKLSDHKLSKREEEEAIRRAKALKEDQGGIRTLRKVSRHEYLKKREPKKLEEIRDDIKDEHYLFNDVKLTQVEERELRYKKQVYELVKKRTQEDDNLNEYQLPNAYDDE